MKNAGYRTPFAGKANFGPNYTPSSDPANLGFDLYLAGFSDGVPVA